MNDVFLILENGMVFKGRAFGYDGEAVGELVFSTGMTGYLETLSDSAYYGQIVMQTFPLVGNYGIISEDFDPLTAQLKAYIVRDWCQEPSNFRSEGNLDSFLREKKIPGIFDIDTRKLTRIIREQGSMNAMISKNEKLTDEQRKALKSYRIKDAVSNCAGTAAKIPDSLCCGEAKSGDFEYCVSLWDFGGAYRLSKLLGKNGICVNKTLAFDAKAEELCSPEVKGIVLSGGPGDPAENTDIINEIKKLLDRKIPILAVGLGHQMLALACGAKTGKLKFGHRGANQAVKQVDSTRCFITAQNHGYVVMADSLPENAAQYYVNVNDGTCEGIIYEEIPALSVSFEPNGEVFSKFKSMMGGGCTNASK